MPNRLVESTSPYLLQHAENPVDWYPWSEEALERAKREDKPIFLSIGYSACHWCHVMAHESFEDPGIARFLNEHFINIKVDREERPDLDEIYMRAMIAIRGGGGGWPLSVFLTPDQEVFFGGTYWPPHTRMNLPGFETVLKSVLKAYREKREEVVQQAKQITQWLAQPPVPETAGVDDQQLIDTSVRHLEREFDAEHGGFGDSPKFPQATALMLLIRLGRRWPANKPQQARRIWTMIETSLKQMAAGGIFDQLGGGFARYSVDRYWLVPHFEKMLYDNALLAHVYLEMYRQTGDGFYCQVAQQTLDYLLRDMRDPAGGFYSAEDADSEGEEGRFYVWTPEEVIDVLGQEWGKTFCELYNVSEYGNFEGSNVLHLTRTIEQFAEERGADPSRLASQMEAARGKLLAARNQRVRPGRDDKVLVSWNGLAISALATASIALPDDRGGRYLEAGIRAARFIRDQLRRPNGRLRRSWRRGTAAGEGYLDDHAHVMVACVDLYDATYDEQWIAWASELAEILIRHFGADQGFYLTADDQPQLIARPRSFQDSSLPSGNGMAAEGLIRLGRLVGRQDWVDAAERTLQAARPFMERSPLACGQSLIALDRRMEDPPQLVLFAKDESERSAIVEAIRKRYPNGVPLLVRTEDGGGGEDSQDSTDRQIDHLVEGKRRLDDQSTLYVCRDFQCQSPLVEIEAILEWIATGDI